MRLLIAARQGAVGFKNDIAACIDNPDDSAIIHASFTGISECELNRCARRAVIAARAGACDRVAGCSRTFGNDAGAIRAGHGYETFQMEVITRIPVDFDVVRQVAGVAVNLKAVGDVRQHRQIHSR